jgi:prepilin-type N-terminal cleavage/methylation domain-containing protein
MGALRKQQGFTLIEIAIVLVIIGLLIGGVLKGQEMITNAKVSKLENDFKGISAAVLSYQDRYGVMPGDDPAASTRFPGTWTAADNGNGNGSIQGGWNSTNNAAESRKIWKHLRGAGFIKGPVDGTAASYQQPTHAFGGLIGFEQGLYSLSGHVVVFGAVPGNIDQIVESRGDNGNPSTGSVQGHATQTAYNINVNYDLAFRF